MAATTEKTRTPKQIFASLNTAVNQMRKQYDALGESIQKAEACRAEWEAHLAGGNGTPRRGKGEDD